MLKTIIIFALFATFSYANEIVNVYSHRHYEVDKQLYKKFEQQSGIEVNLIKASSAELIKRIEKEGAYTKADVLLTTDVGMLELARSKGIFQSIDSKFLNETIPLHLKDKENSWFGLTKRARVITYNLDAISKEELTNYEALTEPKYKNRVVITKSNEVYNQSLLASFIVQNGEERALMWAKKMKENMARKPTGVDKDSLRAVAAGIGDVAVVNTYYIGQMKNEKNSSDKEAADLIGVFFPNQGANERGTHINVSGAGVVKESKNRANAIKFIEFLASVEAQEEFSAVNFEYPVNEKAKVSDLLLSWGSFKEDTTSLYEIGTKNSNAVKIFHQVGWDE
ncbi:MAG: extracellular solute-binding protein [Sulfurimonas sp.]|nr:extracellular solute-binding protein [Sulfurimonas sp.]